MNCSHIIVRTELSTGEGDLDVKIQLAEEAGKEVMHQYEGAVGQYDSLCADAKG